MYVVKCPAIVGCYKIGATRVNLIDRINQICTPLPEKCEYIGFACARPFDVEARVHRALAQHRRGGEWFAASEELVMATVTRELSR